MTSISSSAVRAGWSVEMTSDGGEVSYTKRSVFEAALALPAASSTAEALTRTLMLPSPSGASCSSKSSAGLPSALLLAADAPLTSSALSAKPYTSSVAVAAKSIGLSLV